MKALCTAWAISAQQKWTGLAPPEGEFREASEFRIYIASTLVSSEKMLDSTKR